MSFDYFYGQQSELFTFYRVPKVLFTNERFWNISADAKMLYGILLDRMSLSAKNGWIDQNGRVYIIFTIDEAKMALNCAEQKAIKLLSELEKKAGLIERKRQGLGKPNLIYVKNFISAVDSQLLNCENHNSGTMEITTQELPKSQCNNTDIKNTEFSDTDSIFPSGNGGMMDENDRYQEYFDYFSDQLSMDLLKKDYPYDSEIYPVHKNFTCNLAGYRLHFTHSNLIGRIRKSMRKKWIFTGVAFALAMTLTGCRDNAAASIPQQSSQEQTKEQTQMIPMEEAQEAALKAADIEAADADISATTLSEVAGVACYKVEFTSGEYAYSYTINAQTGAVMEMSSQEQNAQTSGTQTETADPAASAPAQTSGSASAQAQTSAAAPAQNATGTGTVDEAAAQKIALEHAGVKAADATITKSKLDYEDGRQVYDIEWYAGGAKYDYEIAADTGEIISSAYEEKTMGADSRNVTVSEADAKKTALDRVSGATDKNLYEWKLDYEDGHPEYEGKIIYGGTEYEFTIDAATGSVMEWDAEKVR